MNGNFATLDEFWPFYVSQHLNPVNRRLHFCGTTLALLLLGASLALRSPWPVLFALLGGYGLAWIGHFVFEKNRPATFGYALLSLRADLRMWRLTLVGRMDGEVARLSPELRSLRSKPTRRP